jgi:phosphoribosylformylglycinamidine synthase
VKTIATRIEVKYKPGIDSQGDVILQKIEALMAEGMIPRAPIGSIEVIDAYSINKEMSDSDLEAVLNIVHDPVTREARTHNPVPDDVDHVIEIGFKPGVTDNVGNTVRQGIEAKLDTMFEGSESTHHSQLLYIAGDLGKDAVRQIGEALANPLIQNINIYSPDTDSQCLRPYIPKVRLIERPDHITVPIRDMTHEELKVLAKQGIMDPVTNERRGPLALDADDALAMHIIVDHYRKIGRDPTDVELEGLAQTWSEHCKHTIFAANLDPGTDDPVPDGLFNTYIRGATEKIRVKWKELGRKDFLLSVFTDNSGIIRFDNRFAITDKVETHNSPSALDPYGGSITGIVGVDRDALGAGMGAMPFNHRFWYCLADPRSMRQLFKRRLPDGTLDQRILSPRSIMDGVVEGVKDGGNKSGIPTPQGGAFFHENYGGKPLVFVGVQGVMPLEVNGKPSWEKKARPGDVIVMIGGRVGVDGIHGATFSSEAMDSGSPASAVQIGDPITQKKYSDMLVKEARDRGLYTDNTDNGAGGLMCSVYEMAKACGGADLDVDKVPTKYPGMIAYETLISESQERQTLAVPPEKVDALMGLARKHGVEATVIGEFTDSGNCVARSKGETVLDLDINFFHDGLPQRELKTTWTPEIYRHDQPFLEELEQWIQAHDQDEDDDPAFYEPDNLTRTLHDMLSRLNICSKEFIFEQFDHEVQGGSVIKPMVGKGKADSPATVTRPVLDSLSGVVDSQALFPRYSRIDTYHMAAAAVDTVVRNMIAAGGRLEHMAIMDNFCWCSSDEPERLGQLKRAAQALHDISVQYLTPMISGKDSMFNTFKGFDADGNAVKIDVLPTLMVSGLSVTPDVTKCQTLDAKVAGDLVYVIGGTKDELGGSEYFALVGEQEEGRNREYIGNKVPSMDKYDRERNLQAYKRMQAAIEQGLVASCASVELGGLGVALAKTAIGGQLGMEIELYDVSASYTELTDEEEASLNRCDTMLFSETMGRFVVTVDPSKKEEFEKCFRNHLFPTTCTQIGRVSDDSRFVVTAVGKEIINAGVADLTESYKKTLRGY